MVLLDALSRAVRALKQAAIEPLILQGAALAETVYGNIAERAFADLDLLIHEEEIEKASECLKALGYARAAKEDLMFCRPGRLPVRLDVHYCVWYLPPAAWERLWKDSQPFSLAGTAARTLPADELLIYTAAHAAIQHGALSPTALEDICRLCHFYQERLSWPALVGKIKQYNLQVPLYHILAAAKAAKGARIPDEALNELKPVALGARLLGAFYRMVWRSTPVPQIGHLLQFISQRGLRGKMRFVARAFFPPRAFIMRRYNVTNPLVVWFFQLVRPMLQLFELVKVLIGQIGNGLPGPGKAPHNAQTAEANPGGYPVR